MTSLTINGKEYGVDATAGMPLLWVIREQCGLTGTKFGCGIAQCGACTVHYGWPACSLLRHTGDLSGREEHHHHRRNSY
jgi:isoquinoline 1-oxidoreductase subunit alpha